MTHATTPDFASDQAENETELDHEVNDDSNLDVDVPADDEQDTVPDESGESGEAKPATAKAARPKAPEGFVKPVEFAKLLSEHLSTPDKKVTVPPQVVYSYIKNNQGESAKNPFPIHELDGYAWYIKPEEGLAWWDAKNTRVAAGKAARADKAASKAAKESQAAPAETDATPVEEAE